MGKRKGRNVRIISSTHTEAGRTTSDQKLCGKLLDEEVTWSHLAARKRQAEEAEHRALKKQRFSDDPMESSDALDHVLDPDLDEVLSGETLAPHSHTSAEEFREILLGSKEEKQKATVRPRRDRVERRNAGFKEQLEDMVNAYMSWDAELGDGGLDDAKPPAPQVRGGLVVEVIDVYRIYKLETGVEDSEERGVAASLIRLGLIPCAPFRPSVVVTIRALELFHSFHHRCPYFAAQAFLKGTCDMLYADYRPYLLEQFLICVDVLTLIKSEVRAKVNEVLAREGMWRLINACSACSYKLEDEPTLKFEMLVTMDGNDSLKRVLRAKEEFVEEGPSMWTSMEQKDNREVSDDYYLSRDEVNNWMNGGDSNSESLAKQNDGTQNPCASRWANMDDASTARAFGVFDETGLFLCLCRHGYCLVMADMVQSGEMAKYPLAVVNRLLKAFGSNIGGGYDIACKFKTTLARSSLGGRAEELNYTPLVGSFHGHAHNRKCQLNYLATYVDGLGLEDLEGCERFFSRSNALAASVRHSGVFRRRQKISEYAKYMDTMETSQNLSQFLVSNYKQALKILEDEPAVKQRMKEQNITDSSVFKMWLKEEQSYLMSLSTEPEIETLEMDYIQGLIDLDAARKKKNEIYATPVEYQPPMSTTERQAAKKNKGKKKSGMPEKQRRDAEELCLALLQKIQDLERRLEIDVRWTLESQEYQEASKKLSCRHYQRCLDELEALVVSRIFELTKMGMARTGYKLRRHIAKALRARSQAVISALKKYNAAARNLKPFPKRELTWGQVVDYAFLSEFDLLRDTRQDIRSKPWARPAGRALMDRYFKIERAREEIQRLNVEIRRVITHLEDEDRFLHAKELSQQNPVFAHQIKRYRKLRTRFANLHRARFNTLASCSQFSGNLTVGRSVDRTLHVNQNQEILADKETMLERIDEDKEDDVDVDADITEQEMRFEALYAVAF